MSTTSIDFGGANYRGESLREDLGNFISDISRSETPFLSTLGTSKATLPNHEWLVDTLRTPNTQTNLETYSFEYTQNHQDSVVAAAPDRVGNYTEIFGEKVYVSTSAIRSDLAGAANAYAYAIKKAGKLVRRDIEYQAVSYNSFTQNARYLKRQGANNQARLMGPVFSYCNNWVRAASATVELNDASGTGNTLTTTQGVGFNIADVIQDNPTKTYGDGSTVVQYTASPTLVQLTEDHITSLLQSMYLAGGRPNTAQIPATLKGRVSRLLVGSNGGAAERRVSELAKRVNLAIDSVLTEFGFDISLVPNYVMNSDTDANGPSTAIVFYDRDMIKKAQLTPMNVEMDGVARYGKAGILTEECTLEVRNANSVGTIIGVKASA